MKKKLFALGMILTLTAGMFMLTGCGDKEAAEEPAAEEKLVVGLDDTFAPLGFRNEKNELVGVDIDLANELGKELGMDVEFKVIDWDAKELELKAETIDCVWNGMSITPDRLEKMSLSDKYLNNKIVLMSLADGGVNVTDGKQLADLKIGTQVDSSALKMLQADPNYESFKDNISEYETYDVAIMDLKAGRVDVIAVDQVLGEYTNKNLNGEMMENDYSLGDDFYVIGFAKDNTELRDKVNEAMKKMFEDGRSEEISNKWFGKNIVVNEPLE